MSCELKRGKDLKSVKVAQITFKGNQSKGLMIYNDLFALSVLKSFLMENFLMPHDVISCFDINNL